MGPGRRRLGDTRCGERHGAPEKAADSGDRGADFALQTATWWLFVGGPCHPPAMTEVTSGERCGCPDEHPTDDGRCIEPSIRSADPGDLTLAKYTWCGCCMADCPDVHGPDGRLPAHYNYLADWSDADGEFVGVAPAFPSLSFLASTPHEALAGIKSLVAAALRDMAGTGESPPAPDAPGSTDGGEP